MRETSAKASGNGIFCAVKRPVRPIPFMENPTSDTFAQYDPFAWIYNQNWGEEYHRQIDAVLEQAFYPHLPPQGRVLDLCCGAGHVTQFVAQKGYRIIGLDGSEEMLHYARKRIPGGEFHRADARYFTLKEPVDGVLSTYDSLNHIMSLPELEQVFLQVRSALRPGGRFLFDMNGDDAYTEPWTHMGSSLDRTRHWVANGACNPMTRIATCEIEEMWRDSEGEWRRKTFQIDQRCYSTEEVTGALAGRGFRDIHAQPAAGLGMTRATAEGRVFYSAVR